MCHQRQSDVSVAYMKGKGSLNNDFRKCKKDFVYILEKKKIRQRRKPFVRLVLVVLLQFVVHDDSIRF